ncbi:MAG: T9SS type A sorting domain-containing protein [Ignavibacteria bacterium]|nr:T9SS type A sorting domain-containing protein [Ignavibacteria bacterium]
MNIISKSIANSVSKYLMNSIWKIALAILVVAPLSSVAQRIDVPLQFLNVTPDGTKEFAFTVAAHPNASDSVDAGLNEIEIPPIPLPGSVFYVWAVAPVAETIWLSPLEIRKHSGGLPTRVDYNLRVNWTGGVLEVLRPLELPKEVDSVYIVDGYSDYPNNFLSVKLGNGVKMSTDNPALDRFTILVWFNGKTSGVTDEIENQGVQVFPNPVNDYLFVKQIVKNTEMIAVYYMDGRLAFSQKVGVDFVGLDTSLLAPGLYQVRTFDAHKVTGFYSFVKQ